MSELGKKFRQHMVLRGFSERTIESYGHAMVQLAKAYPGVSLDQLSQAPCHSGACLWIRLAGERNLPFATLPHRKCTGSHDGARGAR
jgi:hypothetical protein